MSFLPFVSALLGWVYTLLWSLSFWPQSINNYKHKSVEGFSKDFAHLNFLGFTSYAIYNLAFLTSKTVQKEYEDRHGDHPNVVRWNDAAFAVHAAILGGIQMGQCWCYTARQNYSIAIPHLSMFAVGSLIILLLIISASTLWASLAAAAEHTGNLNVDWLDVVNILSYTKLYITLVKYFPQINLNRKRRSTKGFSVENCLLDFSGGVLSLLQLVIDASLINHDWSGITGNFGKLGLSLLSLVFDLVLITQHFILFDSAKPRGELNDQKTHHSLDVERRPLLGEAVREPSRLDACAEPDGLVIQ